MDNPINTALPAAAPPVDPALLAQIKRKMVYESKTKNGLSWFYVIAGMSLLNTVIYRFGGGLTFVVGLAATQFVDGFTRALANEFGGSTGLQIVGFAIDVIIAGVFVAAGYMGRKGFRWVVVIGMGLYLLDALLFVVFSEWLAVIFHAYALYGLYQGLAALNALRQLEASGPALPPQSAFAAAALQAENGPKQVSRTFKIIFWVLLGFMLLTFLVFLVIWIPLLIKQ